MEEQLHGALVGGGVNDAATAAGVARLEQWGTTLVEADERPSGRVMAPQLDADDLTQRLRRRWTAGNAVTSSGVDEDRTLWAGGTARSLVAGVFVVVNLTLIALWSSVVSTLRSCAGSEATIVGMF